MGWFPIAYLHYIAWPKFSIPFYLHYAQMGREGGDAQYRYRRRHRVYLTIVLIMNMGMYGIRIDNIYESYWKTLHDEKTVQTNESKTAYIEERY